MADSKISALTALTGAAAATDDEFVLVDTSVTTTKKMTMEQARRALGPVLATAQASTSGTAIDFTGIPAGVKRIKVMLVGVSTNGSSELLIQLGDAGGLESTLYLTTVSSQAGVVTNSTGGFIVTSGMGAAGIVSGEYVLDLHNSSTFSWVGMGIMKLSVLGMSFGAGEKALSAELTQVRVTTVNGTDTFDAGSINISYE